VVLDFKLSYRSLFEIGGLDALDLCAVLLNISVFFSYHILSEWPSGPYIN